MKNLQFFADHSFRVALKCYVISKVVYGFDEDRATKMYYLGLLHDIGHFRCGVDSLHGPKGADILTEMFGYPDELTVYARAIKYHGSPSTILNDIEEILNYADVTTDIHGKDQTIYNALWDVRDNSDSYTAQMAEQLTRYLEHIDRKVRDADIDFDNYYL